MMVSPDCGDIMLKQKILEFVLKNWKAILIVLLLIVVSMKNRHDYKLMQKAYETQADSHEAQIEGLKQIHKRELREKQKLMESHLESIAQIEEDYEEALQLIKEIREDKKANIETNLITTESS